MSEQGPLCWKARQSIREPNVWQLLDPQGNRVAVQLTQEVAEHLARGMNQAPLVEELVGALARRPIPPSDADVFRALGDPVRWMDRYRSWYEETRALLLRVREAPTDRGTAQEKGA